MSHLIANRWTMFMSIIKRKSRTICKGITIDRSSFAYVLTGSRLRLYCNAQTDLFVYEMYNLYSREPIRWKYSAILPLLLRYRYYRSFTLKALSTVGWRPRRLLLAKLMAS